MSSNDNGNVELFFSKAELDEFQKLEKELAAEEDLINTLRELLERAEKGEIKGFAFCTVTHDNTKGTGWDGFDCRDSLGLAIGLLNHRYLQATLSNDEEE